MIEFGTGGWREIIGDGFTKENITKIALGLASMMKEKEIVIGYDRRFMSKEASYWFIEALSTQGIKSYLIDKPSPTPVIMCATKQYNTEFGVAITASHNPAIYNGVKLFTKGGKDATIDVTNKITKFSNAINNLSNQSFEKALELGLVERIDPFNYYIDSILSTLNIEAIRNANLKVIVDPMYGVSKTSLTTILATTRCEVDIINERHDTLFGGRLPTPTSKSLHKLMDLVVSQKYDLGIATDGDADRVGIVDEHGNFIHPNTLISLLYYYLLEYKKWKGAAIRNLSTTHMLDKIAKKYNQKCIETPVGFKHISSAMEEYDAIIGGESSGGLTVKGHIQGKDGIFAASLLIEMISVTKKSIYNLTLDLEKEFGKLIFSENSYRFSLEKKQQIYNKLFTDKKIPSSYQKIKKCDYYDGLKIVFEDDSWISARFSGTEPVLRIFAEATNQQNCDFLVKEMEDFLNLKEKQ